MAEGRSVRLYLVDGTASGILTAEIMNWTGHVLAAPRTRIEAAFDRDELKRTGVYFLHGAAISGAEGPKLYIGEGDDISKRIFQHNKEKDFWDRLIAVTSKDMNLTKAHVRYLEGRLITLACNAKKAHLENKDRPTFDKLPEADVADMEAFLREIELVLPTIGADFLKKPGALDENQPVDEFRDRESPNKASQTVFYVHNLKSDITARAQEIDGEFVILAGSIGSCSQRVSFPDRIKSIREHAMETGLISRTADGANFQCNGNIAFSSPSAAAVFLFGTSRNGRTDWLVEGQEINYGQFKDSVLRSIAKNDP